MELDDADRSRILALARDLPRVWHSETTTNAQRKNLLRMLAEEVTLTPIYEPELTTMTVQFDDDDEVVRAK